MKLFRFYSVTLRNVCYDVPLWGSETKLDALLNVQKFM